MNAAVRAIVRTALAHRMSVLGIEDGYEGLIQGRARRLHRSSVSGILERGGCMLGTARSAAFRTPEGRVRAAENLRAAGVDGLVVIGGDGTAAGADALAREHEIPVMLLPGSIDNDVCGTDSSIGFDTAANTAVDAVDRIRDTADALKRIFFVEVMGRESGALALHVGVAGGADAILVPERPLERAELVSVVREAARPYKRSTIIVVAEGERPGGAFAIARDVCREIQREYRVAVLGYIQRGGAPTAADRVLAAQLGVAAVEALREGHPSAVVGRVRGQVALTPLSRCAGVRRRAPLDFIRLAEVLSR